MVGKPKSIVNDGQEKMNSWKRKDMQFMLDRKSEDFPSEGENLRKGTRDSVFFSPSG